MIFLFMHELKIYFKIDYKWGRVGIEMRGICVRTFLVPMDIAPVRQMVSPSKHMLGFDFLDIFAVDSEKTQLCDVVCFC